MSGAHFSVADPFTPLFLTGTYTYVGTHVRGLTAVFGWVGGFGVLRGGCANCARKGLACGTCRRGRREAPPSRRRRLHARQTWRIGSPDGIRRRTGRRPGPRRAGPASQNGSRSLHSDIQKSAWRWSLSFPRIPTSAAISGSGKGSDAAGPRPPAAAGPDTGAPACPVARRSSSRDTASTGGPDPASHGTAPLHSGGRVQ